MPIVFAGITPHTPALLPNIGKEGLDKLKKTHLALKKMEEKLYLSRPDIIIVFSPHADIYPETFKLYTSTTFESNYEHFGDFTTKDTWNSAPNFTAILCEELRKKQIIAHIQNISKLDHGSSIPLHFLTPHIKKIKILPISHTELSSKKHLEFGQIVKSVCAVSTERIAVIASANLSHALTSHSPAGYHKAGNEFDEKIIKLLESHNSSGITNMDPQFVIDAAEYGYKSIVMLLGVIQKINYRFKNYCYESPFGVGYLTGEFEFD
jgi:aromatic ring-opening dioxygenase LigB subunit